MQANPKRYIDAEGNPITPFRNSYENACDCLYYGMGKGEWEDCGIPKERRNEVWNQAFYDMSDGVDEWLR